MSKKVHPNKLRDNDWRAVCDVCGLSFWGSTMQHRWDGAFVDTKCWEPFQDGYKSKVIKEDRSVPTSRNRTFVASQNSLAQTPPTAGSSNDGLWYVVEDA